MAALSRMPFTVQVPSERMPYYLRDSGLALRPTCTARERIFLKVIIRQPVGGQEITKKFAIPLFCERELHLVGPFT